ncbi:unnamed protein product [Effrenium voratum]|nr:unnamed protein product [Effrenium voratum]
MVLVCARTLPIDQFQIVQSEPWVLGLYCTYKQVTERTVLTEEPNGGIFATEVNVGYSPGQGAENQALRREVARLERVLNDVQEQLRIVQCQGGAARELACWQSPGYHISKVHERLYLDASNRQERKKALQESTQQARECEVLGMFRSQHPWINALAQSEPQSHCPVPGGASAVEAQDVWVKPKKPASAGRKRLLPSPRSPSQATDSVGPEGTASPHEYLPLVVSSLTGDEQTARPRPRSASAAMGQVSRPRLSHVRGLPLQHCPSQVAARRPASAASALDQRTMQEGLRLLATKPGQVPLTRPRSVGSLRCLL